MIFHETKISGLVLIEPFKFEDDRGIFVKTFHAKEFEEHGLETDFQESFYSDSQLGTLRGMHFQLPPEDHVKLVFCTSGYIKDVVLDLRKNSPTFKEHLAFSLNYENRNMLYIPKGCAHGFCVTSEDATVHYFTTTVHSKEHDAGIRFDSFGYQWPFKSFNISERDLAHPSLEDFDSPF